MTAGNEEKIMGNVGPFETEDEWAPYQGPEVLRREQDERVRMFALDMAVQALPALASSVDGEEQKLRIVDRAAKQFEKYLRGESTT